MHSIRIERKNILRMVQKILFLIIRKDLIRLKIILVRLNTFHFFKQRRDD
jgi:hypothetical protein